MDLFYVHLKTQSKIWIFLLPSDFAPETRAKQRKWSMWERTLLFPDIHKQKIFTCSIQMPVSSVFELENNQREPGNRAVFVCKKWRIGSGQRASFNTEADGYKQVRPERQQQSELLIRSVHRAATTLEPARAATGAAGGGPQCFVGFVEL